MKLNRQIALFAVLIASAVMFVHAVVPHHHRASDLAMCTVEKVESCSHSVSEIDSDDQTEISIYGADCNSCTCSGVKCAPILPFMLRCGCGGSAEAGEHMHVGDDMKLLPFILAGIISTNDLLVSNLLSENLYPSDCVPPLAECVLESLSRRGPPVL